MPTLSIDMTAQQATRVAAALGKDRGLTDANGAPRSATAAEVRAWVIDVLKRLVHGTELRAAQEAVQQPSNLDIA